jgi:hypothetical protein
MAIHKHNFYLGLVMLVALGISVFFVTRLGLYPVAAVNWQLILAKEFRVMVDSAFGFYLRAIDTYKKEMLTDADAAKLYAEVQRATLDKLIEERIMEKELDRRFGSGGFDEVDKKLGGVENKKLGSAANALYGLTDEQFKKMVLEPQARREVLAEDFKKQNQDFSTWLREAKREASVYVFLPGFLWGNSNK